MEMIKETAKVVRQQQIDEGIFDMELSFLRGSISKARTIYCNVL